MEDIREEIECIFETEKSFINKGLPYADIQHVGGTSITGSITKKELDIQIRITSDKLDETIKFFENSSYKPYHKELWTETFAIMAAEKSGIPVDYMITVIGATQDDHYKVRDFLRENKDVLADYNNLKILYTGRDYADYVKAKQEFFIGHGKIKFLVKDP